MRMTRFLVVAVAALALAAGCSGSDDEPAAEVGQATEVTNLAAVAEGRTIIDVRTPEEFDTGHVRDAVNIDVQDPSFDARIGELAPDEPYLVYCRSGNRSAIAVARMAELGFTDVVDGGGYDALVSAGLPTA